MTKIEKIHSVMLGDDSSDLKSTELNTGEMKEAKIQADVLNLIRIGDDESVEFRKQLKELWRKADRNSDKEFKFFLWSAAAVFMVLLGISIFLLMINRTVPKWEELYAQNYQPYSVKMTTRGNVHNKGHFEQALVLYKKENYRQALMFFKAMEETEPEASYFFSALCFHELNLNSQALKNISKAKVYNLCFHDHILWYEALFLIRENRMDEAAKNLNLLVDKSATYQDRALRLRSQLEAK